MSADPSRGRTNSNNVAGVCESLLRVSIGFPEGLLRDGRVGVPQGVRCDHTEVTLAQELSLSLLLQPLPTYFGCTEACSMDLPSV